MAKKVFFIILESDNKKRTVCDLTEKCYELGLRMVFYAADPDSAREFDNMLWIWKQSSFIPHLFTETMDQSYDEPVVITSKIADSSGYDLLLSHDPVDSGLVEKFDFVIDFAEKYNQTLIKNSRDRFRQYQKNNWQIDSIPPGRFLQMSSL